jgi:hypothetical protein
MTMEGAVVALEKSASRLSRSNLSADIKALIAKTAAPAETAVLLGLKGQVG